MNDFAYVFAWSYLTGFLLVLTIKFLVDTKDEDN
tara:strand:+ start:372 stop:473 length:102 start_codon:yes stop_codon:yes gene_type:complete